MSEPQTQVPVTRNSAEGPVPSAWRPVIENIVEALVRHDYRLDDGMAGVGPISEQTAAHICSHIQDYGARLAPLPPASWNTSVCIWRQDHWDALIALWTEEEGSSDLVLQIQVWEIEGEFVVTIYMVYVP